MRKKIRRYGMRITRIMLALVLAFVVLGDVLIFQGVGS